ncbi:MAG: DUF1080 domain-containing protein [Puniceicoccales bacterium]|jgi:hypothetical protein|nr:DUF1080 domain-containing protein [Puniceicoccales bacterium]
MPLGTIVLAAALSISPAIVHGGNSNDVPKVQGVLQTTPPPSGAEVLFDGTEATAAANWGPEGKLWPIKDGVWVDTARDVFTKKAYGSCKLHLEWRVPSHHTNSNGQKAGNSGVIFHGVQRDKKSKSGWYEVQILESHSNTGTYDDGMAGAIYQHSAPRVNPSLPKGEWQSYDITFTAPKFDGDGNVTAYPRFTVVYNGVTVQDDYELKSTTFSRGDAKPGQFKVHPTRQPILLQWHKDPIEFRNIWIVDLEKPAESCSTTSQNSKKTVTAGKP